MPNFENWEKSCICKTPLNPDQLYIKCDKCDDYGLRLILPLSNSFCSPKWIRIINRQASILAKIRFLVKTFRQLGLNGLFR